MAAGLTALVIILFLGNIRLSFIILVAIPLSIITAVLFINLAGQTLNTMTLGGFALAIGILVDNGTVVIENIERHVAMNEPLHHSIVTGAAEVAVPTFLSTLCICIVFVPVFLLQGTAKYLFSPLSLSVIGALVASLALAFTLVPVLFNYLMAGSVHRFEAEAEHRMVGEHPPTRNPLVRAQQAFERGFESFRERYRNALAWTLSEPVTTVTAFVVLMVLSALLFPQLGRDFFPQVDAGQMRLHVRAPPGTRIETHAGVLRRRGGADPQAGRQRSNRHHARQHRTSLQRHQYRAQRFGHRGADGRRDPDFVEREAHADCEADRDAAPRAAQTLCRAAVLLPAGGHRRSGVELRPAGADRRAGVRAGSGRRLRSRLADRARPGARAGRRRFARLPGSRCAGLDGRYGSRARDLGGNHAAGGRGQRARGHQFERADLARTSGSTRATA